MPWGELVTLCLQCCWLCSPLCFQRFFYRCIWRTWDEEEEDEFDYFVRCVEPRLRLWVQHFCCSWGRPLECVMWEKWLTIRCKKPLLTCKPKQVCSNSIHYLLVKILYGKNMIEAATWFLSLGVPSDSAPNPAVVILTLVWVLILIKAGMGGSILYLWA